MSRHMVTAVTASRTPSAFGVRRRHKGGLPFRCISQLPQLKISAATL